MTNVGTWSLGAVWRRWDPHLHAPGTLLSDQFKGSWDEYLHRIEAATPTIEALGVTDYMCIRTYKAVQEQKTKGRLQEVRFLFPNVEMRLDLKTEKAKSINLHLLFSPEDENHVAEIEAVLAQLTCEYADRPWRCCETDLAAIGRLVNPSVKDETTALQLGAGQFKVPLLALKDLQRKHVWFRENCLIAVAGSNNDGTAGLGPDDSFKLARIEIEKFADIIFAATPKQREYWLGRGVDSPDTIERVYRSLKPCMHGSDAHRLETVGSPQLDRYCWIKGDASFEGLRQAVIEPAERVWIGARSPANGPSSMKVSSMQVHDAPWLGRSEMTFNPGLVAIIGERGSGKTALVDILGRSAFATGAGTVEASFLQRAGELLGNASVEMSWSDGTSTRRELQATSFDFDDDESPQVRYLSQQFVDGLCSATGLATQLREEIERVVYDATDQTQRFGACSFQEMADIWLEPARRRREDLRVLLHNVAEEIQREDDLASRLVAMKKQQSEVREKMRKARVELKALLPQGQEMRAQKLVELEKVCSETERRVETLRRAQKRLDDLGREVEHLSTNAEPARAAKMRTTFTAAGLSDADWGGFSMRFIGDVDAIIKRRRAEIETQVQIAMEGASGPTANVNITPLNRIQAELGALKIAVGIDAQQQAKYDALNRIIRRTETEEENLTREIEHASGAAERRKMLVAARRQHYAEVFGTFVEEENALEQLYRPLGERLAGGTGAAAKLKLIVYRRIDLPAWIEEGERLLDLRANSKFRGRGTLRVIAEKELLSAWRTGSAVEVSEAIDAFRLQYQEELLKARPSTLTDFERRQWIHEVASWLASTKHVSIEYAITYDGVAIERLSPGTRGIVLLVLFLVVDRSDRRPLIIDQPEENLDPKSVFDELVPHFREARRYRQVIIVTHNANLVVNTDADQVIVARAQPTASGRLPTISYTAGSLESKTIRADVCAILEGGERAFIERERRYRIKRLDLSRESET